MFWSKQRRLERARDKFAEDDPLRCQHVLRSERETDDPPLEDVGPGGSLTEEDLQWYLDNPDG